MASKKNKEDKNVKASGYTDNKIYIDLKNQLIKNNNYSAYTEDLLLQYMKFTEIEEQLDADISARGVSVYWCNGGGQEGWKKNDSITELNRVSLQKTKLLTFLGIRAPKTEGNNGGDSYVV